MLPTASLSLSDILSGPFILDVPVYQRPYSWAREQAEQLFDDLTETAGLGANSKADPGYFLGMILLMDKPGNTTQRISARMTPREYDIVDGQQRLVTLTTLFAVLRDLNANQGVSGQLAKRIEAITTVRQGVRMFRTSRPRIQLLPADREFFEKSILVPGSCLHSVDIDALPAPVRSLALVRDVLVSKLKELDAPQRERLFHYVTRNCYCNIIVSHDIDRAHRTFIVLNERGKKLQRNDILKADILGQLPPQNVEWAANVWDDVSLKLGSDFDALFAHLRAIYDHNRPQIVSGVRAVIQDAGGAENFMRTAFVPLSSAYSLIKSGGAGLPPSMQRHLASLNRLADGDWAPAAMLALKDWPASPAKAEKALAEIERLAHLLRLLSMGAGKRSRRLASLTEVIRSGDALDESSPAVQLSREEVRSIAFHLNDLHSRDSKACKTLLLRLSEEIDSHFPISADDYTIEHILPQRPPGTSLWRRWFPSSEERARLAGSLGNLTLITQKQNERAKNASFLAKKKIYETPEAERLLLPITADIMGNDEWHPVDIVAREEKLIKIIETIWRIDLNWSRKVPVTQQSPEPEKAEDGVADQLSPN